MRSFLIHKNLLQTLFLIVMSSTGMANEISPACPNGVCPGLGHAFYMPELNLLDPTAQTSRRQILRNTAMGTCATKTRSGSSRKDFQAFESAMTAISAWSANLSTTGNGAGGAVSGFSLNATASTNYERTSLKTEDTASVSLDYVLLDSVVDLNQNTSCWSVDNLDPGFLSSFEALPINDPKLAAEASSWADYRNFLRSWGSHVQVKQELGSRLQILESEKSTDSVDTQTLKAKICFSLGYAAFDVPACLDFSASEKVTASTKDTVEKIYIAGGNSQTRNKLISSRVGMFNSEDVSAFINSASNGDQAIGFKYRPIWELLMDVYRSSCVTTKDNNACQNFQRAVNLQAAYEGFLAYNCILNRTASADPNQPGLFVQGMIALPANGNGITYYACKQTKAGCSNDNDCQAGKLFDGLEFEPIFKQCFCEGAGCITTQPIAGTNQFRSIIKNREPNKSTANSDIGVNDSCRDGGLSCTCNTSWAGGEQEREIYNQAVGAGGSGSFTGIQSAKSATTQAEVIDESGTSKDVYTVTVLLKNPTPHTKTEDKSQAKLANAARDTVGTFGYQVSSTDSVATIECPGHCSGKFAKNSLVTLEARKRVGSQVFKSWSKNTCLNNGGTGRVCVIPDLKSDMVVEAFYD